MHKLVLVLELTDDQFNQLSQKTLCIPEFLVGLISNAADSSVNGQAMFTGPKVFAAVEKALHYKLP